jgi:peroxiredoxin
MAALETPQATIGWSARPFSLKGVDGKTHALDDVKGERGLLVMFICNHCPFVKVVIDRIIRDTRELKEHGIGSVAIMSNDTVNYPEDSFDNMRRWAKEKAFPFPYLLDATQEVARAYGAVCTPDFFGFDANLRLQYRGRIDAATPSNPAPNARRELFEAMLQVAQTGKAPQQQHPSIGCSIKWNE